MILLAIHGGVIAFATARARRTYERCEAINGRRESFFGSQFEAIIKGGSVSLPLEVS